jgi:hypothetical protein
VETARRNTIVAQYFWSEFLSSAALTRVCFCGTLVREGTSWPHCNCWSRAFNPVDDKATQEDLRLLLDEVCMPSTVYTFFSVAHTYSLCARYTAQSTVYPISTVAYAQPLHTFS